MLQHLIEGMSSLKLIAQQAVEKSGLTSPLEQQLQQPPPPQQPPPAPETCAVIPPMLGVAPLGTAPLTKDQQYQFQMLDAAFYHMPHPSDTERVRPYIPRNPVATPHYYIQVLITFFL